MRRCAVGTELRTFDFSLLLRLRIWFKIARKYFISQKPNLVRSALPKYRVPDIYTARRAKPQANFTALCNITYR